MTKENTLHAHVSETGESRFAVSIDVAGHRITGDEGVDAGGGNLGPSPYALLLAALGECTAMTVRWYARQKGWPLDKVEVTLTHRKENRTDLFTKHITLHGDRLDETQRSALVAVAAKCPVQRTLEGTPVITTL